MNLAAFYHSGMYPEIYAPDRFHLRFSFRAASGDIETCTLVYFHKNHRDETTKEERMLERYHLGPQVVYVAWFLFKAGEISSVLFSSDGKRRGYALV